MDETPMVQIDDVIVPLDVFREKFCCDLQACGGACCVEGDAGAPVTEEEVEKLEEALPFVENDLSPEAKALIGSQGVCYVDEEGDLVTSIVRGKDCVFTCYDAGGCCACALERASRGGKLRGFRKPISCFLYPLRVKQYKDFYALNYHRWEVCRAAREKGEREGIRLYEFLREPLEERFGRAWYAELLDVAAALRREGYLDDK